MKEEQAEQVSSGRRWLTAARPWSFPASTMPVIFGTSLAFVIGRAPLDIVGFLLAFLAMVILHSAANMLSDVFDFKRGLDTRVTPVSGALVRGWLTSTQTVRGAVILFILGSGLGLILVLRTGLLLLVIGGVGVVIGIFYAGLKYRALGDLAVFLNFGILGSLGAWVVQTGSFSWVPVLWTISMAILVVAILHANNWRDVATDSPLEVRTVAGLLGDKGSLVYYGFLLFGAFTLLAVWIVLPRLAPIGLPPMPLTFLLTLLALPAALKLWGKALRRKNPRQPMDFIILDGATAQFNTIFGLFCTAAVWLDELIRVI